uniref:Uncharacterized protein n=1 Tax=Setaria italica TaxID=4555 RepID=K3Y0Z0_SETIT
MELMCSSPHLKTKHRKNLRLPDPPHPLPSDDDKDDDDFILEPIETVPSLDAHATRKRWRGEASSSVHYLVDPTKDTNNGDDDGQDKKIRPVSLQCSPFKFAELVATIDNEIKDRLCSMGFGGLLEFNPTILDRSLLTWLMDKFNPDTIKLEFGSGKEIEINEHSVWCVFLLTKEKLKFRTLAGDLAVRSFLMHAFCTLLFSYTDNYIRLDDVVWTDDLDRIGGIKWCKAVVDSLKVATRLYRLEKKTKGSDAPITGCGIFLIMLYVGRLQHRLDIDQARLPRCSVLDNRIIDRVAAMDRRGDVPSAVIEYNNLELRSLSSTCYVSPPAAAPAPAPAYAPSIAAAAARPSAPSSSTMDAPVLFNYPSFFSSFGQSLCELVGRSKNSKAEKILRSYDASTAKAQSMMRKAHNLTRTANELMAKAHHECYIGIEKLLNDARAT